MGKLRGKFGTAGRSLEVLWTSGTLTGLGDAQLLRRFTEARDATAESAFRELVHRHGPMVLGICRQVVREPHGAEDAFQATFLVLVRKARSVRVRGSLAPWLYVVAHRTARRARASSARYRPADAERMEALGSSPDEAYHFDLRPLLLEELDRLPAKYREPIVLCHLEGKTHEEAARLLQCPVGTVSGRLSRGRQLLKSRLERRGLAVPSAMFATPWLTGLRSTLSLPLEESTFTAAARFAAAQPVSASVLSLTHGVLRTMLLRKLKAVALAVLLVGTASGSVGVWAHRPSQAPGEPARAVRPSSNPAATPVPSANPAPPPATGARPLVADKGPADSATDCPVFGADGPPAGCPFTMAANAFARVFSHFHDGHLVSRVSP
jgi:RNA polymerase sigma factor (sigma-70 family)